jgi:hypothetical protein
VKVASDKAGLKAFHSENTLSKSVAVNQNVMNTADNGKGIVVSNMPDYRHSHNDFGRNSLTGYQVNFSMHCKSLLVSMKHPEFLVAFYAF